MQSKDQQNVWHRHKNPDGSMGGLVHKTAKVASSVYVGPEALVGEYSQVKDRVRILDKGRVTGRLVEGDVVIYGHGRVGESAHAKGQAVIGENATIGSNAIVQGYTVVKGNTLVLAWDVVLCGGVFNEEGLLPFRHKDNQFIFNEDGSIALDTISSVNAVVRLNTDFAARLDKSTSQGRAAR